MSKFYSLIVVVLSVLASVLVGCSGSDMPSGPTLEEGCVPEAGVRTCVVLPTQAAPKAVEPKTQPISVKVEPTVAPLPKSAGDAATLLAVAAQCGRLVGNDAAKLAVCVKCLSNGVGSEFYPADNECFVPKK